MDQTIRPGDFFICDGVLERCESVSADGEYIFEYIGFVPLHKDKCVKIDTSKFIITKRSLAECQEIWKAR